MTQDSKKTNLLKKRTKEKFFFNEGDTYKQDQVNLSEQVGNCYMKYNNTIYDLSPLNRQGPFYMNTVVPGKKIQFNMCKNSVALCNKEVRGMITSLNVESTNCKQFSDSWSKDKKWAWENSESFSLIFPTGGICNPTTNEKYQVAMSLKCNKDLRAPRIVNDATFDETKCQNTIVIETKEGINI